jgi:hypothetical protein
MTKSEQFAIDEWLLEYPKNASFDDILYMIIDPKNKSIVPFSHGENMTRQDLGNCIAGTETHFFYVMNQEEQA